MNKPTTAATMNRVIFRQVPAWVLECAASRLQEREESALAMNCGGRLARLLSKGPAGDARTRAFVKQNLGLIDMEVPFGWAGALTTAPAATYLD